MDKALSASISAISVVSAGRLYNTCRLCTLIVCLIACCSCTGVNRTVSAGTTRSVGDLSAVTKTGRWHSEVLDGELVQICISSGNSLHFKVAQTASVGLEFNPRADISGGSMIFEYSIDGAPFRRTGEVTSSPVLLATDLSMNEHTIEVVLNIPYYQDAWSGHYGAELKGVCLDEGGIVSPWDRQWRGKALWIGDSIVEGEQSIAAGDISNLKKSSRQTYSWQVSRNHNMEYHTWAFGGMGMTQWYPRNQGIGGPRRMPTLVNNFGYKMNGVPADDDPDYDWIVLEVGVNDYDARQESFEAAYGSFLSHLKKKWPEARLFCIGPMPIPGFTTQAASIEKIATNAGCTWISSVGWSELINNHLHPLAEEHAAIATAISGKFEAPRSR